MRTMATRSMAAKERGEGWTVEQWVEWNGLTGLEMAPNSSPRSSQERNGASHGVQGIPWMFEVAAVGGC